MSVDDTVSSQYPVTCVGLGRFVKMKFSERYHFADWPNPAIPKVAAGVYAIWNDDQLFYCASRQEESYQRQLNE